MPWEEIGVAAFEQRLGVLEECVILKLPGWSSKPATVEQSPRVHNTYASPGGECFGDVRSVQAALGNSMLQGEGAEIVSLIDNARASIITEWLEGALQRQRANFELKLMEHVKALESGWNASYAKSKENLNAAEQAFDPGHMTAAMACDRTPDEAEARHKARKQAIRGSLLCLRAIRAMLDEQGFPLEKMSKDFEDQLAEELDTCQHRYEAAATEFNTAAREVAKMRVTLASVCKEQRDKFQQAHGDLFRSQNENATDKREHIAQFVSNLATETVSEGDADFESLQRLVADLGETLASHGMVREAAGGDSNSRRRKPFKIFARFKRPLLRPVCNDNNLEETAESKGTVEPEQRLLNEYDPQNALATFKISTAHLSPKELTGLQIEVDGDMVRDIGSSLVFPSSAFPRDIFPSASVIREFTVQLKKEAHAPIGIELEPLDGRMLCIVNVMSAGLINDYNCKCFNVADQVCPYDILVSANGIADSSEQIMERLLQDHALNLVLRRLQPWQITVEQKGSSIRRYLTGAENGRILVIRGTDATAFEDWNRVNPDLQVCTNDFILKINGIEGDASKMLEIINDASTLDIQIARPFRQHVDFSL